MTELVDVHLLGLPLAVHQRASAHMDAVRRELDLIRLSTSDASSVPHRLRTLVDDLSQRYDGIGTEPSGVLDEAVARGDETVDLHYRVPRSVADDAQRLGDLLDEVDEYCGRDGPLLTLVTPDEALRYRRWFLGEFIRQLDGAPPSPWPAETAWVARPAEAPEPSVGPGPAMPEGWSVAARDGVARVVVSGPLDLETAPALREVLTTTIRACDALVLDLRAVDFLDSVGTSVLIAAHLRGREDARPVRIVAGERCREVLELAGLDGELDLIEADDAG